MEQLTQAWSKAKVVEPLGFVDDNFHTVGALVITADEPLILSLNPGADFELNTDIIHEWKVVFQTSNGEVLGDATYSVFLQEIQPFVKDQQNGSILINALSDNDITELHAKTIFSD